jgi:protoporphyrinogen/coproporphyrinogen III oxidase
VLVKHAVVVGGGLSGLATAYFLQSGARAQGIDLQVTVLEQAERTGGKIWSIRADGYLCEWGPNGFLDSKPHTLELCAALGVADQLLRSNDNARKRYVYSGGMLHRLPENAVSFFASRLLSWPGKLRLALEPFVAGPPQGIDETLAAFGRRRLGAEALQKLIAPMVSGIFAGDPETMSLRSCFPRIAELESDYGGLVMAMLRLARKKRRERAAGKVVSSAAGPGGVLTSFHAGIQQLTDSLVASLGSGAVLTGQSVEQIRSIDGTFRVKTADRECDADLVVVAAPAFAAAPLLRDLDEHLHGLLGQIAYASMSVVCFGFEQERIEHDLNGFGYLGAKPEGLNSLGTLWDSSIFANRAPEGHVLLRSMVGGACFPQYINLSDEELVRCVREDLQRTMGITAAPSFVRIFRHQKAIPQYTVGHGSRLQALAERLQQRPGLLLTGNSYRGIGLNDCVASAVRAAREGLQYLADR